MNHHDLIDTLATTASLDDLPGEARDHLDACEDCARVARALAVVATHPEAAAPAPPAGYWEDFERRLETRLQGERDRVVPFRRRTAGPVALTRIAAALVLVLAGWAAVRGVSDGTPSADDGALTRVALLSPDLLVEEAEALTEAWPETWSERTDVWSLATSSDSDEWDGLLDDPLAPLDAVGDELVGELTDDQAAALARRLRQEISS